MKKLILSILSTIIICSMVGAQTFAYLPISTRCYDDSELTKTNIAYFNDFQNTCACKDCELVIIRYDAISDVINEDSYNVKLTNNYNIIWNTSIDAVKHHTIKNAGLTLAAGGNISIAVILLVSAAWSAPVIVGVALGSAAILGGGVLSIYENNQEKIFLSAKEYSQHEIDLAINQLKILSDSISKKKYIGNNYLQLAMNRDVTNPQTYAQFMYRDGISKLSSDADIDKTMNNLNDTIKLILKNYEEGKYNLHAGETYAPWWYTTVKKVRNVTLTGAALLDLALFFNKTGKIPDLKSIQNNLETFGVPAAQINKFADFYKKAEKLSKSDKKDFWSKISEAGEMSVDLNFSDNAKSNIDTGKLSSNIDKAIKVLDNVKKSAPAA